MFRSPFEVNSGAPLEPCMRAASAKDQVIVVYPPKEIDHSEEMVSAPHCGGLE
jgi:hypothetical protein